jgi:hypothetical protein
MGVKQRLDQGKGKVMIVQREPPSAFWTRAPSRSRIPSRTQAGHLLDEAPDHSFLMPDLIAVARSLRPALLDVRLYQGLLEKRRQDAALFLSENQSKFDFACSSHNLPPDSDLQRTAVIEGRYAN